MLKQTLPANSSDTKALVSNSFYNEIYFYEKIWPELDKFQKSFPDVTRFTHIPKFYAALKTPGEEKLLIENLKYSGFQLFPRSKPFDDIHMKLLMKTYGHYHALSASYREYNPDEFKILTNVLKDSTGSVLEMKRLALFTTFCFQQNYDMVTDGNVKEKIKKYIKNSSKIAKENLMYNGKNPVINHGDCWSNNFMFNMNVSILTILCRKYTVKSFNKKKPHVNFYPVILEEVKDFD